MELEPSSALSIERSNKAFKTQCLKWAGYLLLPFAAMSAFGLILTATVELAQPHLILPPDQIPKTTGAILSVDNGPVILVNPQWGNLRISETWLYEVVSRQHFNSM
jgi:hypothetical protein